jgi:hypothetical protein
MRIGGNITMLINPAKVRGTLANVIDNGMNMAGAVMVGYLKDIYSKTGGPPSRPGTPPAVQSGVLMRATQKTPSVRGVVYVHTSKAPYAAKLEYGGWVKPTNKQYLAIPIGREGKRIRKEVKESLTNSPRNLFVIKSKKGNLLLMERHGKRQKVTPRFVLKRSVFIKARPFMRPALASRTVQRAMARAFAMRIMRDVRRLVEA